MKKNNKNSFREVLSDKEAKLKRVTSNIYRKDIKKMTELVKNYHPLMNKLDKEKRKAVEFFMDPFQFQENNRYTSEKKDGKDTKESIPTDSVKY